MAYRSTRDVVEDLDRHGYLVRVTEAVDPYLEMGEIQRRVFAAGGPALFFENVKGSDFPAASNLFGDIDRARFIFRRTIAGVKALIAAKADPSTVFAPPSNLLRIPFTGIHALPLPAVFSKPVLKHRTSIDRLPQIVSWPRDGGAFITLPQVYSEDPAAPGILKANSGMYRVQLGGNRYKQNEQIGLHYQIHRGIGVHHTSAKERGEPLRVSIFVGGPPAHSFAAVMPLPEGLPETAFAGAFAGRNMRYTKLKSGHTVAVDADFCIVGTVEAQTLPEGPFGDHLGYYSLKHDFPVLRVEGVYHRANAVWPFTTVGRPPQEDTIFGALIHELTAPMVPVSIPGLKAMHAVDAAGVHPLLLAVGKERYTPYASAQDDPKQRRPQEILTIANAILGFNQASLAKYLMIAADGDDPRLDLHHIDRFLMHVLARADFSRDLHFQTRTTIDTLDYSGSGLNQGSKLVIAAAGAPKRELVNELPANFPLVNGCRDPRLVLPGIVAVRAQKFESDRAAAALVRRFADRLKRALRSGQPKLKKTLRNTALIVLCDDSEFTSRTLNNFLWVTFTRSNPSHDVHGVDEFIVHKHWGCHGPLIIDARSKPHHAWPLEEDPKVTARVDELFAKGGSLHGIE